MVIFKKIHNNIALGLDSNDVEVVVFGKGIGFEKMPYELTDMSKIQKTYYGIDDKLLGLLSEIPENIFILISKLVELSKSKINKELNPNLVFTLADHINFAIERQKKGLYVSMPVSYELEYEYPVIMDISKWFINTINKKLNVHLSANEATSIAMHFINALTGDKDSSHSSHDKTSLALNNVTAIIEDFFKMKIDKKDFNYLRYKNHIKYFVQRKEKNKQYLNMDEKIFDSLVNEYPDIYNCIVLIDDYFHEEFKQRCTKEELLYLLIHVERLVTKENFIQDNK